jgi:type II secretory ATPase GspE/PulE/Tfp pilus assembly ATPase PilB-like protein
LKEMIETQFSDLPEKFKKDMPNMGEITRIHPTPECPNGTRGRAAVFEVMDMTVELEKAILARKPEDELYAIARKSGMLTMKEHAIIRSMQGAVPFEEVNTLGGNFDMLEADTEPVLTELPAESGDPSASGAESSANSAAV